GRGRVVPIGPRGQEIIRPWLRLNVQEYLFQPREALEHRWRCDRAVRKTKVQPSQVCRKRRKPQVQPGDHYTTGSYALGINRAVQAANTAAACEACKPLEAEQRCAACLAKAIPHFHPHQLRHTKATEIRKQFGLDAAR